MSVTGMAGCRKRRVKYAYKDGVPLICVGVLGWKGADVPWQLGLQAQVAIYLIVLGSVCVEGGRDKSLQQHRG